jgi:hypothetical protein
MVFAGPLSRPAPPWWEWRARKIGLGHEQDNRRVDGMPAVELREVRAVAEVRAGDGRAELVLVTGGGARLALELPLPVLLAATNALLRAAVERWPDLAFRDPPLEPEPILYAATAFRLRAVVRPAAGLFVHLRSAHAGPLVVGLGGGMVGPLLRQLARVHRKRRLSLAITHISDRPQGPL